MHESELHDENCFLTLTYDEDHVPDNFSLDKSHFTLFMKRLRKALVEPDPLVRNSDQVGTLRYFQCGEYGEKKGRPHHHVCLFGWMPKDLVFVENSSGFPVFSSAFLDEKWGLGAVVVGELTFDSAAYVAAYCLKKTTGKRAGEAYTSLDPDTGEITEVEPPYATMSRRPGIGAEWLKRYTSDVYPRDSVLINGREVLPPKYYDSRFEMENPEVFAELKKRREERREKRSSGKLFAADRNMTARFNLKRKGDL